MCQDQTNSKRTTKVSSYPSRPWERVGMDLFEFEGSTYLIVVCYRSRWPEVKKLTRTTSAGVIQTLKCIIATHGIPDLVVSDNGPQFASEEFKEFGRSYNFNHVTSSPNYPAVNGEAERSVRTVKEIFKKSKDPYLALLTYCTTPLQNGLSPSELIMGRKLRTPLPMMPAKLDQKVLKEALEEVEEREANYREKQAKTFDEKHRSTLLPQLRIGTSIYSMYEWSERWLLRFHPDKCKTMHIGNNNREPMSYKLKPDIPGMDITTSEKDVGVIIDNKLSFDLHIAEKVNKANSVAGAIRRSFEYLDKDTFKKLYTALVRPHLEYANAVWNPYKKKDNYLRECPTKSNQNGTWIGR